jgi:hypothetical protein
MVKDVELHTHTLLDVRYSKEEPYTVLVLHKTYIMYAPWC